MICPLSLSFRTAVRGTEPARNPKSKIKYLLYRYPKVHSCTLGLPIDTILQFHKKIKKIFIGFHNLLGKCGFQFGNMIKFLRFLQFIWSFFLRFLAVSSGLRNPKILDLVTFCSVLSELLLQVGADLVYDFFGPNRYKMVEFFAFSIFHRVKTLTQTSGIQWIFHEQEHNPNCIIYFLIYNKDEKCCVEWYKKTAASEEAAGNGQTE